MSKFSITPSDMCQSLDNISRMTLVDPGNHCEYSRFLLSMRRSASCLLSLIFLRISCGCLLVSGLRALWSQPIAVVLSPMDMRYSSPYSMSSIISIHINTSSAQNYNRLISARPQYYLGICHFHALLFDLKPPIIISQALAR